MKCRENRILQILVIFQVINNQIFAVE